MKAKAIAGARQRLKLGAEVPDEAFVVTRPVGFERVWKGLKAAGKDFEAVYEVFSVRHVPTGKKVTVKVTDAAETRTHNSQSAVVCLVSAAVGAPAIVAEACGVHLPEFAEWGALGVHSVLALLAGAEFFPAARNLLRACDEQEGYAPELGATLRTSSWHFVLQLAAVLGPPAALHAAMTAFELGKGVNDLADGTGKDRDWSAAALVHSFSDGTRRNLSQAQELLSLAGAALGIGPPREPGRGWRGGLGEEGMRAEGRDVFEECLDRAESDRVSASA